MFQIKEPVRELRSNNKQQIERPRTNTVKYDLNIRIHGAIYWDSLPTSVRGAATVANFKHRLKFINEFENHSHPQ